MDFETLDLATMLLLLGAGFFAGWVDAVVGGGGLVQLPAVLMIPGLGPVQALAINKLGSSLGTAASALTYYGRIRPNLRLVLPAALLAAASSFGGAVVATLIPASAFKPIILCALIGVLTFTILKPSAGAKTELKHTGWKQMVLSLLVGLIIGFYDGLLGPGTGSFLVISMITLLGYNFLTAAAQAKIINLATNLGALAFFSLSGNLIWQLGLLLGLANFLGGYLGARTALARGNSFIRLMMICVVSALILKLAYDIFWV